MQTLSIKEFRNNFTRLYKAKEAIEVTYTDIKTGEIKTVGIFTPKETKDVLPLYKAGATIKNKVRPLQEEQREDFTFSNDEAKTCKKEGCSSIAIKNGYCYTHSI